jgi:hypothetical protein
MNNKVYMIYYRDPEDNTFDKMPLTTASSEENAYQKIMSEKCKAKTDDEKRLDYFYEELVI